MRPLVATEARTSASVGTGQRGLELDPGVDDRPEYASEGGGAKASGRTPGCRREDLGFAEPVSALPG